MEITGMSHSGTLEPKALLVRLRAYPSYFAALASIVAVCIVSYLPAVDNFFISDDFDMFVVIEAAQNSPRWFFESTPEFFRLMSFVYFGACYWLFGLNPQPYYWAGIALHAVVSILVFFLVRDLTGSSRGAWAAGLFFAAYERHQEAIMWISAANETILALNCMAFLLLWRRAAERKSTGYFVLAHLMFALALLSKESAVAMVPLAGIQLLMSGHSVRTVLQKSIGLIGMAGAFVLIWLAVAQRNPFVTLGYYALGWQFFSVYSRSLLRLVAQLAPLTAALGIIGYRRSEHDSTGSAESRPKQEPAAWRNSVIFFSAFLLLTIVPYSFLTYLNHIPSRHTYLPSIGLAGLLGIVFAALYGSVRTEWSRRICVLSLLAIVTGNIGYIWLKKEPQYQQRAAPTRELIELLNASNTPRLPMYVCRFPLNDWVFNEAVARFTPFDSNSVILDDNCDTAGGMSVRWNEATSTYITFNSDSD
jgi:hypothetical protein